MVSTIFLPILQSLALQRPNTHLLMPSITTVHLLSMGVHTWLKTHYLENHRCQKLYRRGTPHFPEVFHNPPPSKFKVSPPKT